MTLSEIAYSRGSREALEKFAAGGQMFSPVKPPSMPPAALPSSPVAHQATPPPIGGTGPQAAPLGMPAASAPPSAPNMGLQTSAVQQTGAPPTQGLSNPAAAQAGRTAVQIGANTTNVSGAGK